MRRRHARGVSRRRGGDVVLDEIGLIPLEVQEMIVCVWSIMARDERVGSSKTS